MRKTIHLDVCRPGDLDVSRTEASEFFLFGKDKPMNAGVPIEFIHLSFDEFADFFDDRLVCEI